MNRRSLIAGAAAFGLCAERAWAQGNAPTTVVSGFPAGGMGDVVARPLLEQLRGKYADVLMVENRAGAGGRIAAEYVKRAAPDGKTILQAPASVLALYPHLYTRLGYDPFQDFIAVGTLCHYAYSFTAGPGLPAEVRTVPDYLKWARQNPSRSMYGIPAAGSPLHFAGMMLKQETGIEFGSVPYRGGAPLLQDLLGGQVPVSFNVLGEVLPGIRSGKLRSLAITSASRSAFLPEVPTMLELGIKGIALQEWLGWFVPARTPPETVRKLNALMREGLASATMQEQLAKSGVESLATTPEQLAEMLKRDHAKWGPIVKATGFKAEE
jgi:tripartite-type tricarboxylate transporter receptor subunit TctC